MRVLKTFAFLAIAKLISGCGLADISSGEFKDQKSNWVVPIFTSQISVESISQLADLKFTRKVEKSNLPDQFQNTNGIIPNIPSSLGLSVGPLRLEDEDDYYIKAKSDKAILRAIVYNNFPIDISAGTTIEIYNDTIFPGETKKLMVYQKTLTKPIKANSIDSLDIQRDSLLGWIANDFEIYLKNFSSPGSNGANVNSGFLEPMKIVFKLIVLKINVVELNQGKTYELADSSNVDLNNSEGYSVDKANFTLFLKNGFPANYDLSCVFKDDNGKVIASLLQPNAEVNPANIPSPKIAWKDTTINNVLVKVGTVGKATKEFQFKTNWSLAKYDSIKRFSKKVVTKGKFTTPKADVPGYDGKPINLIHDNKIGVTLSGEFEVNYDLGDDE